jgi:hypothetical protein
VDGAGIHGGLQWPMSDYRKAEGTGVMAYRDSHGIERKDMSFSEALEIIHAMAAANVPDENDMIYGGAGMEAMRDRQRTAVDMLEDLITNYSEEIDEEYAVTLVAGKWDQEVVGDNNVAPPDSPSGYLTICLAMAEQAPVDPKRNEAIRQVQAIDLTRDFIGLYGQRLDQKILALDTSPLSM